MSGSQEKPWSTNPNAPQLSYYWYFSEKSNFAGCIINPILYGIVIAQFFQCMSALLYRTRSDIKWGLVILTLIMFSCATLYTAGGLYPQSAAFIDNRGFPGIGTLPPGPLGYQFLTATDPLNSVCFFVVYLNQWLADGLLLYRCCVIFSMNYWFLALPCLMYLASVALGIMFIYEALRPVTSSIYPATTLAFYVISVSLNILLTLMIVVRLILHKKNFRNALGTAQRSDGLYNTVVTMLIESCAISAITYVLYIVTWVTGNPTQLMFYPLLIVSQVVGQLLIIERVANRTAFSANSTTSRSAGPIRFKSRGRSTVGDETLADGDPVGSVDTGGETSGESIGVESIDIANDTGVPSSNRPGGSGRMSVEGPVVKA